MFGSVGTILVGGTFGDIWKPVDRTIPTALFSYVAIFGTVAAPIYAGFVDQVSNVTKSHEFKADDVISLRAWVHGGRNGFR
jgi:hypothetical protein